MEPIIITDGRVRRPTINEMMKLLSPQNKALMEAYTKELEQIYAPSHVNSLTREALKYVLRLQNARIDSAIESTNRTVVKYCFAIESKTSIVIQQRMGYLRIFLRFLSSEYELSPSLEMTAELFMYDRIVFIDDLSKARQHAYKVSAKLCEPISHDEFWDCACKLYAVLDESGYSSAVKHSLLRAWKCLYVFLCANNLDYTPAIAALWLEDALSPELANWYSSRRAFAMIDRYISDGCTDPTAVCCKKGKEIDSLPTWCANLLGEYLAEKEKDGLAANSLKLQRTCALRFCEYLLTRGLEGWNELNPQVVMDFHFQDQHASVAGKNAYSSRIRQFLAFLAKQALVPETLQLALPSSRVKEVAIVQTLTQEELDLIETFRMCAESPIELRSISIVMLGLRLGLRGSDIVTLKLADINWQKQELSFVQCKTNVRLSLPLPIKVANCLYRYIMYGRPKTPSSSLFVRHHAPFCALKRSACREALAKVLRNDRIKPIGFHMTRKTFASRMLSSSVPLDTIADALGQKTKTTVHKYVATDEVGMRHCAIPLAATIAEQGLMVL